MEAIGEQEIGPDNETESAFLSKYVFLLCVLRMF